MCSSVSGCAPSARSRHCLRPMCWPDSARRGGAPIVWPPGSTNVRPTPAFLLRIGRSPPRSIRRPIASIGWPSVPDRWPTISTNGSSTRASRASVLPSRQRPNTARPSCGSGGTRVRCPPARSRIASVAARRVAQRFCRDAAERGIARVSLLPDEIIPAKGRQLGFWGGETEVDERAARVAARLQGQLGSDAVRVPEHRGGRHPDRATRARSRGHRRAQRSNRHARGR